MMKSALMFTLILTSQAFAAYSPKTEVTPQVDRYKVLKALGESSNQRTKTIFAMGPEGYRELQAIAFDPQFSTENRWRALHVMFRLGKEKSQAELERALTDKEWFMRVAGLKLLAQVNSAAAQTWASKLLESDQALLVRAFATDVLKTAKDPKSLDLLVKKLEDRDSYKNQKSLWIRPRIVEAIGVIGGKSFSSKLVELLDDRDDAVRRQALVALENAHQKKLGTKADPLTVRVSHWKSWWKQSASQVF